MQETFIVWRDNERIEIDNPDNMAENLERFNTCSHRTPEEIDIPIQTCCSTVLKKGYKCLQLNIPFLSPSVCISCVQYRKKGSQGSQESQETPG